MTALRQPPTGTLTAPSRPRAWREVIGFASVGVVAFAVQFGLFNLLVHLAIGPLSANAVALLVSTAVAYAGNRCWSFAHRAGRARHREVGAFLAVNVATFVLAELLLALAYPLGVDHDRLAVNLLNLLGIAVGTVVRFIAYRRWVFVPNTTDTPSR